MRNPQVSSRGRNDDDRASAVMCAVVGDTA
jgi:hypothetical protein